MPDETVGAMVLVIRKCAHVAEYGVLSILFWRALRKPQKNDPRPWSWLTARNAFLCTLLYAATDELHQIFVPSRQGMLADVFIDMAGALFGLLFVRVFWLSRKRA